MNPIAKIGKKLAKILAGLTKVQNSLTDAIVDAEWEGVLPTSPTGNRDEELRQAYSYLAKAWNILHQKEKGGK